MADPNCPICRQPVLLARKNPTFPFCSDRCKLVDLGRWLSDSYRIPVQDDEDQPPAGAPGGEGSLH